jgi:acyl-CoA dehydrogenase
MTSTDALLFNPATYDPTQFDAATQRLLKATIEWFEARGKRQLLADDEDAVWVSDFLEFAKKEKLFATFLTPAAYADGDENRR